MSVRILTEKLIVMCGCISYGIYQCHLCLDSQRGKRKNKQNDYMYYINFIPTYAFPTESQLCITSTCDVRVCSIIQILKPSEKKAKYQYSGLNSGRPNTGAKAATNTT